MAAAVLAAVLGTICAERAQAGPETNLGGPDRILFFSGIDLWRHGAFSHAGALWAPQGLDFEGFVLKFAAGAGTYRYRSGALGTDVTGHTFSASLLPGWRFKRGSFTLTAFAGLDLQRHTLTPDDVTSKLRGSSAGLIGGAELWVEPTGETMIAADLSATTIGPSYSARAAFGLRLFDRFYAGPEIAGFAYDTTYRQFRVGAQITALKTGAFEWSVGLGWTRDSDERQGLYGRLGLLMRTRPSF